MSKIKCRVGQQVYSDGDSGFCRGGWSTVTDIQKRFDEITGKEYELIICETQEFRSDNGACVKGALAYYLTGAVREGK